MDETLNLYKSPKNDFEYLNFLGMGAYGKVFRVQKKHGIDKNKIYAIKSMCKYQVSRNAKGVGHVVTELNVLKSLKHPFLVELMYVFQEETKIYFVLEYLSGGTLHDLLIKRFLFREPAALFYMQELILAIEHLHSKNIIHRDLKPQNVLLDSSGHVKLIDFGLAKEGIHDDKLTRTICGTPAYIAPEIVINKSGYGKAADWWSLGILFYKLVAGLKPFIINSFKDLTLQTYKTKYRMPRGLSLEAQNLITRLIVINPDERLGSSGAQEVKDHICFVNTSWDNVFKRLETPPFVPSDGKSTDDVQTDYSDDFIPDSATKNTVDARNNDVFKNFYFVNSELIEKL